MDNYSTLEAVPPGQQRHNNHYDQYYPEVAPEGHDAPETVPLEGHQYQGIQAYKDGDKASAQPWINPESGNARDRRKCGLPIKIFYTILIIAVVVVVGAIAGGVAGGVTASKNKNKAPANETSDGNQTSPDSPPNINILAESKLTACNWTDPNNVNHRFVFFQDPTSALIARRWDSDNKTWTTDNLTDIFVRAGTPISAYGPSTPLASVAFYQQDVMNEVHLYYLSPQNVISSVGLFSVLDSPDEWTYGPIADDRLITTPGSQLASAWSRCPGEDCGWGYTTVLYQATPDGALTYVNGTDRSTPIALVEAGTVAQNSSLAIFPEVSLDNFEDGLTRLTAVTESLTSTTSGVVQQTLYNSDGWDPWGTVLTATTLPPPNPRFQLAITALDNFNSPIFMGLLPDGTVTAQIWENKRNDFVKIPTVEFQGGPSVNFSAIAASEEAMFYGVSGDQILQYSINTADPSKFEYVETIYP